MAASWITCSFDQISDEWEEILPSTWTNEIFLTPTWQNIWWDNFGNESSLHLFALKEGSRLVGIAPLAKHEGALTFIGGSDLFDYHDFVVVIGEEELFYRKLVDLIQDIGFEFLDLKSIPEKSPTLQLMGKYLREIDVKVDIHEEDVTPFLKLQGTWEQYLSSLKKKNRHEINRKLRRLESSGSYIQEICETPSEHSNCMDDFFRLMRLSSPEKAEFLTPQRQRFFLELSRRLPSPEMFSLYFLEFDSLRVASCICFQYSGNSYLYNSGYDPEYSHLSVGLLNKVLCIKETITSNQVKFDFLRGSERYKYNLGAENHIVFQMTATK